MKKLTSCLLLVLLLSAGLFIYHNKPAVAAYNQNNLIDDFTFDDTSTMNASQIDAWLNTFSGSCISTNSGFSASEPTGYSPTSSSFFGRYSYGSPVSAGQVIYDVSVAHQINPQVLLTKLQNEEGLVRGDGTYGCGATAITASVGYACTDSGTFSHDYSYTGADPYTDSSALLTPLYYRNGTPVNSVSGNCVNSNLDAGFSEQIVHAAWLLSFSRHRSEGQNTWAAVSGSWNHCDDNNTCPANMNIPSSWACYSGLMTQGSFKRCSTDTTPVFYDGYATIDGTAVHMDTGGTAALYVYTPHFQSFDTIFNQFFGSQYSNDSFSPHPDGTLISSSGRVYLLENGLRHWILNGYVFDSYHFSWGQIKTATTGDNNLPLGTSYDTLAPGTIFRSDNTPVYIMTYDSGSLVKQQISYAAFNSLGYSWNEVMYVPPVVLPTATSASILFNLQHPAGTLISGNGKIYLLDQTSKRWVLGPYAFSTNNFSWDHVKSATSLDLSLPDGADVDFRQGAVLYSSGNIYVVGYDGSGVLKRPLGPWECFSNRWHYTWSDMYGIPTSQLPARSGSLATC